MPAAPAKYPHLSWKFNRIHLRIAIPKVVQPILGKAMFHLVMPQRDMPEAYVASLPILAEWRRRIIDAHTASRDQQQAEIMRLRTQFESYDGKPLGQSGGELFGRIMDFVFQTYGGVSAAAQRLALANAKGDVELALRSLPAPAKGQQALALITGTIAPSTPFLAHMEGEQGWKARTHLRGKTLHSAVAAIEGFAKAVPCDLETLSGGMVQKWIDDQLRPTDGSKPSLPGTVRKKVQGCRYYWTWMQDNDKGADKERHPFSKRPIRDHRTARERKEAEPLPFEVSDVPRLWQQAEGDTDLQAAIWIAAHTGMRREEICALKIDQVRTHDGIRYLHEVGDKTVSAIRNVPIPSAIAPLIDTLIANATDDGYLLHDGWTDKNGFRGGEVGSRFSDMKTAMGFRRRQHTFNSLRKTAIKVMKEQKVLTPPFLLSVIKNIVGHHDADITSGRYAGTSGLADKFQVIETINYPA